MSDAARQDGNGRASRYFVEIAGHPEPGLHEKRDVLQVPFPEFVYYGRYRFQYGFV